MTATVVEWAPSLANDRSPERLKTARVRLRRFKLASELHEDTLGDFDHIVYPEEEAKRIAATAENAHFAAIMAAGRCGLLGGLELRDETGRLFNVIAGLDLKSDPMAAMLVYRDGGGCYFSSLNLIGVGGDHLALPGTREVYDRATLEALDARLTEAGA